MESVENLVKKYKKMGTNQVISQLGRVTGVAKEACLEVLRSRGQDVSEWETVIEIPVKESEFRKVGSSSIFEASPEEELTQKELQRVQSEERILNKGLQKVVSNKDVKLDKVVTQKKISITPLTDEQSSRINQDIELYQKGEMSKRDMIVSWMNFGITKQQIDKFVDSKIVGWSYAYSVYREYGK